MSQIAVVWRVLSPLLLGHRLVVGTRSWAMALLHLVAAFATAAGVYLLVMLVTVELYGPGWLLAGLVYGVGMGLATWFGTCAGGLAARASQQHLVANGVAGLAFAFSVGLAVHGNLAGQDQAVYLMYVLGSGAGGLAAVRLMSTMPPGSTISI